MAGYLYNAVTLCYHSMWIAHVATVDMFVLQTDMIWCLYFYYETLGLISVSLSLYSQCLAHGHPLSTGELILYPLVSTFFLVPGCCYGLSFVMSSKESFSIPDPPHTNFGR